MLWKSLISRYGGRVTEALDVSSLAKITDGYTPGHMAQAIQHILTERRLQQVGVNTIPAHLMALSVFCDVIVLDNTGNLRLG